jgi:hypothetical protein
LLRLLLYGKETMTEAGALETLVNQQIIIAMKAHDADPHRHAAADQERAQEQGH